MLSQAQIKQLAKRLGISLNHCPLIVQAFTHTSYVNEKRDHTLLDNERLEFLGDAVLELIVSEHLYKTYPEHSEGSLTKIRAAVICEHTLAKRAKILGLGEFMLLGRGESMAGGRTRNSLLADAFEAIIGAVYLNLGLEVVRKFVLSQLVIEIEAVVRGEYGQDYKTVLQEKIQKDGHGSLEYKLVDEIGPDHHKTFVMNVLLNGQQIATGSGRSKKEAEQLAAKSALQYIKD